MTRSTPFPRARELRSCAGAAALSFVTSPASVCFGAAQPPAPCYMQRPESHGQVVCEPGNEFALFLKHRFSLKCLADASPAVQARGLSAVAFGTSAATSLGGETPGDSVTSFLCNHPFSGFVEKEDFFFTSYFF